MNKKILCYGLSFIMSVALLVFAFGGGLIFGFFDEGSLQMAFNESDSFNSVREDLLKNIDKTTMPDFIDILTIEHIISKDMVWADVTSYISSVYRGEEYKLNEESFDNSYYHGLHAMLTERNILVTSELEKEIDAYLPVIKEYYSNCIISVKLDEFVRFKNNSGGTVKTGVIIGAIVAFLCGVALWISAGEKKERLRFFSHSFIAGGIMTMIIPSIRLINQGYLKLAIKQELYYKLATTVLRNGLITINVCGAFLVVTGVVFAVTDILSGVKEKTE